MSLRKGEQKGLMMGILALIVVVGGLWAFGYIDIAPEEPLTAFPREPAPGLPVATPTVETCRGLAQLPSTTFHAYTKYNPGTELTENVMYREVGGYGWTEIAAGSAVARAFGTHLEIMWGDCDSTPIETMQGPLMVYTYPCRETDDLYIAVANDVADDSDMTVQHYDSDGDAGDVQAITNGDIKTLSITIEGKFEQDYGNMDCGIDSNLLIAKYQTSTIDDITVTSIKKETTAPSTDPTINFDVTTGYVPVGIAGNLSASGYALKGWKFPVVESNTKIRATYVLDADDDNDPGDVLTFYIYDSGYYLDNDVNKVFCGLEDEDQNGIGLDTDDGYVVIDTIIT